MVKGFIMRENLGPIDGNVVDQSSLKVNEEDVAEEFKTKLRNAVALCNKAAVPQVLPKTTKDETRYCEEIKYHLNQ
jgi:hypothetical protein